MTISIILPDAHSTLGIFDTPGRCTPDKILSIAIGYDGTVGGISASMSELPFKNLENRVTANHGGGSNFIHVSFDGLANAGFSSKDVEAEKKIEEFLRSGIILQHRRPGDESNRTRKFIFCGHSNSQLKSRSCFFYGTDGAERIETIINGFGKFGEIKTIEKYAKRIALLFSTSILDTVLEPEDTLDIPDVERGGHVFTDGCGIISESYAKSLLITSGLKKDLPPNYIPSVFQIRYKGYKGILMVAPDEFVQEKVGATNDRGVFAKLRAGFFNAGNTAAGTKFALFRKSMKKFEGCPDDTLGILGYSKPSFAAALNAETVNLLASNGIHGDIFLQKQRRYLNYVRSVDYDSRSSVVEFLKLERRFDLIKKLERQSCPNNIPGWIQTTVQALKRQAAVSKSLNADGMARVHIPIPTARLLFGACDISGTLPAGHCYIRITSTELTESVVVTGKVIVTRNPCLFPGDIQIFTALGDVPALAHLTDCIVFSTAGNEPAAATLSGGDLDGDKFFVSWDPDLIKMQVKDFLDYSLLVPASNPVPEVTWDMRIQYFAHYTTSLGEITSLYWKWVNGNPKEKANSPQCHELAKLYARCVDGERVEIPRHLTKPPPRPVGQMDILQQLKQNIKDRHLDDPGATKVPHSFICDPPKHGTVVSRMRVEKASLDFNKAGKLLVWLGVLGMRGVREWLLSLALVVMVTGIVVDTTKQESEPWGKWVTSLMVCIPIIMVMFLLANFQRARKWLQGLVVVVMVTSIIVDNADISAATWETLVIYLSVCVLIVVIILLATSKKARLCFVCTAVVGMITSAIANILQGPGDPWPQLETFFIRLAGMVFIFFLDKCCPKFFPSVFRLVRKIVGIILRGVRLVARALYRIHIYFQNLSTNQYLRRNPNQQQRRNGQRREPREYYVYR